MTDGDTAQYSRSSSYGLGAIVTVDTETTFRAELLGTGHWNGFLLPYFSAEIAQHVADWYNRKSHPGQSIIWSAEEESFVSSEPDHTETFPTITFDGQTVYGIGVGSWAWEAGTP